MLLRLVHNHTLAVDRFLLLLNTAVCTIFDLYKQLMADIDAVHVHVHRDKGHIYTGVIWEEEVHVVWDAAWFCATRLCSNNLAFYY